MEPQRFNPVRKVKIIYINDPGSNKPRPVYVTATSQPNTYQILQNPVIVTTASDGYTRYMDAPMTTTMAATVSHHPYQYPPPSTQPQAFYSRPPILHHYHQQPPQQQPSTARRALIPPRRPLNPQPPPPIQQQPQKQPQKLPKLPAPFDFPEIKNFVSSKILPYLTPDYVDGYFMDLFGAAPNVGKDFNVQTMECPMLAPVPEKAPAPPTLTAVRNNLKHIPPNPQASTALIRMPNEQRNAPVIMRRAVQNNRQRLNAAAPYTISKENRQVRIIHPANPRPNTAPQIRPAIIRNVRPVRPQTKMIPPISQQPSPSSNFPLQVQNPSNP